MAALSTEAEPELAETPTLASAPLAEIEKCTRTMPVPPARFCRVRRIFEKTLPG